MRILILCGLLLFTFKTKAQTEIVDSRIVLLTDSINIFGEKFVSTKFSHSYFILKIKFKSPFIESDYDSFAQKAKGFNSEIKTFKSIDNNELNCVFPKSSLEKISSLMDFVKLYFPNFNRSTVLTSETKHIQVVREFDPKNSEEQKGFN
jgi:hypothetical protein